MRRTTIFRSSYVLVATVVCLTHATVVRAQDTPAGQVIQQPTVHVVVQGETLWELAARYLGDPFLWPEIYRLNTLVVEDPHWIFPGEELRLVPPQEIEAPAELVAVEPAAPDTVQAVGVEAPPEELPEEVMPPAPVAPAPPPTETSPTVFLEGGPGGGLVETRATSAAYRYRPIRRGEFYAAGFLTEEEKLPWAPVLGAVGRPALRNLTGSSSAYIFGEVELTAPRGATYQVGDSLLVARIGREIRDWGNVVVPTGIVRVTSVAGREIRADVVTQFGRVADGQFALPLEPFANPGDMVPVPIENGAMGEVIGNRDRAVVTGQQDIVFINLGRADGVVLGDVFEVLRPRDDATAAEFPWEPLAVLEIVHVRERSASGFVVNVLDFGLEQGAPVRLVRKMPS